MWLVRTEPVMAFILNKKFKNKRWLMSAGFSPRLSSAKQRVFDEASENHDQTGT